MQELQKNIWAAADILPRRRHVPDAVTGGQDTVGLRVPDHPVALAQLAARAGQEQGDDADA